MPGTYPTLSTGQSFCYPVKKRLVQRAGAHTFADLSQVRYKKGSPLVEFEFNYPRISTADKDTLRTFYEAQKGEYSHDWTLNFDDVTYSNCQFMGPFAAQCVGPKLWSVTLRVRCLQTIALLPQTAVLSVASALTLTTYNANGSLQLGGALIPFVFQGSGWGSRTDTQSLSTTGSLYSTVLSASIVGTLPGDGLAQFQIFDVSIQATYADSSTAILRPTVAQVVPGSTGQILSPTSAVDTDPSTFALIERSHFSPLGTPYVLQLTGFL